MVSQFRIFFGKTHQFLWSNFYAAKDLRWSFSELKCTKRLFLRRQRRLRNVDSLSVSHTASDASPLEEITPIVMSDWKLKYLTTFDFSSTVPDCQPRPTIYDPHGWPEEPERSSKLAIFTEDNVYGALQLSSKDVILFTVDLCRGIVKPRSVEIIFKAATKAATVAFSVKSMSIFSI